MSHHVVVDTGPLVAAANRRDAAHELAAALIVALGRNLLIPSPVLVETDHLLRARVGERSARLFLRSVAAGAHGVSYLTPDLLRDAVRIDLHFAALDLGFTDASVMAVAEREGVPILTFDFEDFRAAPSQRGPWELVVDERRYHFATQ
ncbi:MAG: type II toxin-antitoxin system VapC family toxin [Egibacteraceae bacterium]